jgi:diguanylate cyclase (GGDEF)-like protein
VALALAFSGLGKVAVDFRQIKFSDQLQTLIGRDTLFVLLEKELARIKRYHQPCSLALVEMGILDKVEKAHGHHQADLLLRQFQKTLGRQLRKSDTLAWLGGPYMALLLPNTRLAGTELALERLRSSGLEILWRSSLRLRPEVSDWRVAVSELDGDEGDAYATLCRFASTLGPNVARRIGLSDNRQILPGPMLIPVGQQPVRQSNHQLVQSGTVANQLG